MMHGRVTVGVLISGKEDVVGVSHILFRTITYYEPLPPPASSCRQVP